MEYSTCIPIKDTLICGFSEAGDSTKAEEYQDDALDIYYKIPDRKNIVKIERYKNISIDRQVLIIYTKDTQTKNVISLSDDVENYTDFQLAGINDYISPEKWNRLFNMDKDSLDSIHLASIKNMQVPSNANFRLLFYKYSEGNRDVNVYTPPDITEKIDHPVIVIR